MPPPNSPGPRGRPGSLVRSLRSWLLTALAAHLLLPSANAQAPVTITVESQARGYPVSPSFIGLSFETQTLLPDKSGAHLFSPTNHTLLKLFRAVGIKSLRIGGATVDMPSVKIPSQADVSQLFAFARAAGVKVIYSLRLLNGNPHDDANLAAFIWQHYRPQLDSFAIGNEPDWKSYHRRDPSITNFSSYLGTWHRFAAAISQAVPGATFCGPDTGGDVLNGPPDAGPGPSWTVSFAEAQAGALPLPTLTQHHYVGGDPKGLTAAQAIQAMLSPAWNTFSNQALFACMAQPALQRGFRYHFTEANDFTGGLTNASDTFASALWALDFLHWWAAHGCAGVNLHNKRWIPTDTIRPGPDGQLRLCPRAYALKAFNLAARGSTRPLALGNPAGLNLTAYAVGSTRELYITLLNKEHGPAAPQATVTLLPESLWAPTASVIFLQASDGRVDATQDITLGDTSITDHWRAHWTPLRHLTTGQYQLTLNPATAALLRIQLHRHKR